MAADATGRITRPRQIYTGELRRKFVPVYERQLSGRISGVCWQGLAPVGPLERLRVLADSPLVLACDVLHLPAGCLLTLSVCQRTLCAADLAG